MARPVSAARALVCGALLVVAATARPALADSPLEPFTLGAGLAVAAPNDRVGGTDLITDFAASYDFGPRTIVPIRAALDANYQLGTGSGAQSAIGGGVSVRLTTPLYAGVGIGVYGISGLGGGAAFGGSGSAGSDVTYATEYFVGERLFSVPGATVAVQATYRLFPATKIGATSFNTYPSNVGLGLRLKL